MQILNETDYRDAMLSRAKSYDIVLATYRLLVHEEKKLSATEWNVICMDEKQTIKNRGTKMSAAAMKLKSQSRIILTERQYRTIYQNFGICSSFSIQVCSAPSTASCRNTSSQLNRTATRNASGNPSK